MQSVKKKFEESARLVESLQNSLREREEAIDSYKKKIITLEFSQEDLKKKETNYLTIIRELEEEMRR
jgi:chromosome segregation ATPase